MKTGGWFPVCEAAEPGFSNNVTAIWYRSLENFQGCDKTGPLLKNGIRLLGELHVLQVFRYSRYMSQNWFVYSKQAERKMGLASLGSKSVGFA